MAAKKDFKFFLAIYMSHYLTIQPPPFQLDTWDLATEDKLLIVMPRGYGKSVIWSICYPLWVILNNPYDLDYHYQKEDLILISNTEALCEKWVKQHKIELLHNELIVADYNPQKGDTWRVDEIEITVPDMEAGGRIVAKGAGAQIRGEHPTELVIDDLENRAQADSDTQRAQMRDYFYQDLWGTLRQEEGRKARVKVVGTFVHPMALLPELYKENWWTKRKYSVYRDDGTPLWPEYQDHDTLLEVRAHVKEKAFSSEYLNEPIINDNPIFLADWIRRFNKDTEVRKDDNKDGLYTILSVDPAISRKQGADYSALVVIQTNFSKNDRYYVPPSSVIQGRYPIDKLVETMYDKYREFNADEIIIETVAFQKAVADEFRRYCERKHWSPRIVEIRPDRDKERRARDIQPLLTRGQVYFDDYDPMVQMLIDQMLVFPTGDHDDLVDAFVQGLQQAKKWRRGRVSRIESNKPHVVLPNGGKRRSRYTGVS